MIAPSTPTSRRSVSLPSPRLPPDPDSQIVVLFNIPSARIISFRTSSSISYPSSNSDIPGAEEEPGTLPSASRFERTIAVGPLRIYRAPGSVAFLNCQNALRPILPKSKCWELEGGKFVLQIRRPQYWRIEVPNKTSEDKIQAEELKEVLGQVLLFEKTPCPFQRSFTVELPELPKTPVKKRPWRPVERPTLEPLIPAINAVERYCASPGSITTTRCISSPVFDHVSATSPTTTIRSINKATSQSLASNPGIESNPVLHGTSDNRAAAALDDQPLSQLPLEGKPPGPALKPSPIESSVPDSVFDPSLLEDARSCGDSTDETDITLGDHFQATYQSLTFEPENETRTQSLQHCSRSITAPPVLTMVTSPPSKHRTKSPLRSSTIVESDSDFSSSAESFHSVESWHSPLAPPSPLHSGPPSPTSTYPYPHNNIFLPKRQHHNRDVSEITITPETPLGWEMTSTPGRESAPRTRSLSPPPKTPTLVHDTYEKSDDEQFEVETPPTVIKSNIRHRATTSSNSRRRALSPLPAAVNLFSPRRRRPTRLQVARHLPTTIVQKTCEILLSPPSHLLHLMLNIASKIAAGEWRGVLSGHGESVHWDFENEYAGDGWAEDDYGMGLRNTHTESKKSRNIPGGSWEVD